MKERDYTNDIEISPDSLDTEWLLQPQLMLKYGETVAEARRSVDYAKERSEIKRAELDKDIRTYPEKYGISKITESAIQGTIILDSEYTELNINFIESKYELEVLLAAIRAIEQKKTALENLVKLHGQMYFAGPKIPRDLTKEWELEQRQKSSNKKIMLRSK